MSVRAGMTTPAHGSWSAVREWPPKELAWGWMLLLQDETPDTCKRWGSFLPPSGAAFLSTVPREVKFVSGLSAVVAEEGCEATFQCVVSPGDALVTWFREGAQLQPSSKFVIAQNGGSHSLTISSLTLEDAGQISVEAEGVTSTAALRVRGA